jgi:type VI secretion system secreted protein Hcp
MADRIYFKIQGEQQGLISAGASSEDSLGNDHQENHQDEIFVQAFKHIITRPVDPRSGQPAGPRAHKPITITKYVDKSSPLLYSALVTGEGLKECVLKFYRDTNKKPNQHYFTITLTNARIVDITASRPTLLNLIEFRDKAWDAPPISYLEDVSLSYSKIEWHHEVANTQALDDTTKPAGS